MSCSKCRLGKVWYALGRKGKLTPRFVGPFEIIKKVGPVAYRLDFPEELNGVHDTFHVSNLKKCLADPTLKVPLDEIQVDAKLNFIEEPVEILESEFKKLKRSRIAIVKVYIIYPILPKSPVYLAELLKKKKQVGSASSSAYSSIHTTTHNGVSERRNRTLLDMVRSMMNLTTLPLSFWDYALEWSATRILIWFPTRKLNKTPYELWYGKVPNLSYLKVWGCEALVKRDTLDKLQQRSVKICLHFEWRRSGLECTTAMSATEVEYIAASEVAMKAVWIRKFILGLGIVPTINEPIRMFCDNSAALYFAKEPGVQRGARHYHRRYHYVRESIALGEIRFLKVHTDDNLADPFTKALSKPNLTQHARSMGLRLANSFM
ncbi:retrotransposon protein, putative, ty1-copia subclass [Tanacetum coccineum]